MLLIASCVVGNCIKGAVATNRVQYAVDGGNIYFDTSTGSIVDCDRESITNAEIPSAISGVSVESIGHNAFAGCSNLTRVVIPESVTSIGDWAFSRSGLTSVVFPNSVNSTGNFAFQECANLSNVVIPYGITNIGKQSFSNCKSLTDIMIPNSVESMDRGAFCGCTNLKNITLSNQIAIIDEIAFLGCSELKHIEIPHGVTSILWNAFSDCSNLETIIIPNSVNYIQGSAFYGCAALSDVYYSGTEEEWNKIEIGNNYYLTSANIHFSVIPNSDNPSQPSLSSGIYFPSGNNYTISSTGMVGINAYIPKIAGAEEPTVTWTVDNKAVEIVGYSPLPLSDTNRLKYVSVQARTLEGTSVITVSTSDGRNASCTVTVSKGTAEPVQSKPKLYALVVSGAQGDKKVGADYDAGIIYDRLCNLQSSYFAVEKKNIHAFAFDAHTKPIDEKTFKDELKFCFSSANKDDIIIFYYSGHAYGNDNYPSKTLGGITFEMQGDIATKFMRFEHICECLGEYKSSNIIILLDCCYAGHMVDDIGSGAFNRDCGIDENRFTIITACKGDQENKPLSIHNAVSPLDWYNTSRFAYGIGAGIGWQDGILHGDTDGDSIVTIGELYEYVKPFVSSKMMPGMADRIFWPMDPQIYPDSNTDERWNFPLFEYHTTQQSANDSLTSAASSTIENVNAAVDTLKESNKTQLTNAIQASPDAQNNLSRVENTYSAANHITVNAPVSSVSAIASSAVKIIGAALNGQTGDTLSLSVDTTAQTPAYDPAVYQNPSWFDMTLTASNSGENLGLKDLDIPVSVTLPIPQGRDASKQYVLHYREDGVVEELTPEIDSTARTARIVITGFSTFAFVEKANEDENSVITVSLNPNGGTAEYLRIPAYVSQEYGALPVPVQPGYRFMGWYTGLESGVKVDPATVVAARNDHTLYARWSAVSLCDLTVADDGATSVNVELGGADAFLYIAAYNSDGRFLDVAICEIDSPGMYALKVDRSNAKSVSAYLLDSELRPLCASEKVDFA